MTIISPMTAMDAGKALQEWADLRATIAPDAVAVKARKHDPDEQVEPMHGLMVNPRLVKAHMYAMRHELESTNGNCLLIPQGFAEEVVVIGHGSIPMPNEFFIWRGNAPEFNEYWRVD